MAESQAEAKVSYPYMTAGQWFGVRAKLRQSVPSSVDVDWVMAALGTSEKGARNVLPQLRAVGLIDTDGRPTDLALDLRDDNEYANACKKILEELYPENLRAAWDNPADEPTSVAAWFMRNAHTGQAAAMNQAKLYLTLLKGELPSPEAAKKAAAKKATPGPAKKATAANSAKEMKTSTDVVHEASNKQPTPPTPAGAGLGPSLHIDMQIHISADASDSQIDTVFKSMAKYLYGRE